MVSCEAFRGLPDIQFVELCSAQLLVAPYVVLGSSVRCPGGGGDEETRTPDPLLAKEMLFQLSYVPFVSTTER